MISALRLALVVSLIFALTLVAVPIQLVARALGLNLAKKIPVFWHKTLLRLLGVRVRLHGKFSDAHPLLLVSNHVSWADILVLGSRKELSFIAKSEVSSWPIINRFARMQGTLFIDRTTRSDTANQADTIASRLLSGDVMVLFAEGTTGDGNKVSPFKSSLLGAAQYAIRQSHIDKVMVQPVAIAYTRLHGLPLARRHQPQASWPGDVRLGPHLFNFLLKSAFDVDVVLGDPLEFTATTNRKEITKAANDQVGAMFGRAMRGEL